MEKNVFKYPEREGRQIELKEKVVKYEDILKTIVAFLNDIGGILIIGVGDQTRTIVGLSEKEIDRYLEEIPRAIDDAIQPYCAPWVRTRTFGNHTVVEIEVFPGDKKPYFLRSEGIPKGVYIRVGSHTKRAQEEFIDELKNSARGRTFDTEPVAGVQVADLDPLALKNFYRGASFDTAMLRADRILTLDPVTREETVTVAGVLFFHPSPQKVLPAAEALYTEFVGSTVDRIRRTEDLSRPLSSLAHELLVRLEQLLVEKMNRKGARLLPSEFEIPPLALREALLNALIHRRYNVHAPIKIGVFENRIEIFSPGNFPGPIDPSNTEAGISYYRNPVLAQLARKVGLVERRGLGFYNMVRSCKENGNPLPIITEGGDYVKVTFSRAKVKEEGELLPKEFASLKKYYQRKEPLTTELVAEALEVSLGTARSRLADLMRRGLLRVEGKGKRTRYVWT